MSHRRRLNIKETSPKGCCFKIDALEFEDGTYGATITITGKTTKTLGLDEFLLFDLSIIRDYLYELRDGYE